MCQETGLANINAAAAAAAAVRILVVKRDSFTCAIAANGEAVPSLQCCSADNNCTFIVYNAFDTATTFFSYSMAHYA